MEIMIGTLTLGTRRRMSIVPRMAMAERSAFCCMQHYLEKRLFRLLPAGGAEQQVLYQKNPYPSRLRGLLL